MIETISKSNIAIIGGGQFCKILLELWYSDSFKIHRPRILGVVDKDSNASGYTYARELGIFTTTDYRALYNLKDLNIIIEITDNKTLCDTIKRTKPPEIRLIDHIESRSLWCSIEIEKEKIKTLKSISASDSNRMQLIDTIEQYTNRISNVISARNQRYQDIERNLSRSERALSQIIQGSTQPTFVIDKDHIITHWNTALENLTGFPAAEMVGTDRQWSPFWEKERPTMADVILDKIETQEIRKLYNGHWSSSALIEEAYEAEAFFPKLGDTGKWCFFTAAPIKAPNGTIVGAIESLWDTTEKKIAEEDHKRHTRELALLCSIYNALNISDNLDERLGDACLKISSYLAADHICIFTLEADGKYHLRYSYNGSDRENFKCLKIKQSSLVSQLTQTCQSIFIDDLTLVNYEETTIIALNGIRSLAYIPMCTKNKRVLGVIRIGSKKMHQYTNEEKRVLELIGNRIGVTVENAVLQGQCQKSEEKYRSLFNNDPNPIFIINARTLKIIDTNHRAQDCYGYSSKEMLNKPFLSLGDAEDEEFSSGLENIAHGGAVFYSKKRHYKKGHIPFYVNINVSYAQYSEGDCFIAATTDITESVEKETQLIQASKMTTLGTMAAGMAHEINQPLNVIQICTDFITKMLKKGVVPSHEDLLTLTDDISGNVQRAAGIIKHMRDFARQSDVVTTRVCINDPIKDVFKVLGHQLHAHEVTLELDIDPDIPFIMAEHNRLEQVFINLVTNAMDAMDEKAAQSEGRKTEKLLKIRSFNENGWVKVTVTDTGTGMPPEFINKIFEPFFTTKEVGKGTGLGVSISYGIVKDYKGVIEVTSEHGKGAAFEVCFPACD
jgi:PAS domain S-box-containing protein